MSIDSLPHQIDNLRCLTLGLVDMEAVEAERPRGNYDRSHSARGVFARPCPCLEAVRFAPMRPSPATAVRLASNRSISAERTVSRTEWLWLFGAILFGAVLRLSFPSRMAIEHFDEGVYASNFWFDVDQGGEYPARHLYAPPLLPMVIEWTMIVASLCGIKPTGFVPIIPSLIAGLATIPSLWWIGRRWFGPSAGIVAAWLVAASDFHASYSRAALTDVPVCLFMLWSVYFIWQALQTGTRRDILLAGLFTGLTWWTKYNGWLPLAIGLSGGTAWQLFLPHAERNLRQFATRWMLIALTAFVIWSPVLWGLQKHGGYAAVAANHRQYVESLEWWPANAAKQLQFAGRYDNWLGAAVELFEARQIRANNIEKRSGTSDDGADDEPVTIVTLPDFIYQKLERRCVVWSWIATPLAMLLVTLAAGLRSIVRDSRSPQGLAVWLLGAWVIGLSFSTPCYHTYPRLALPWLISIWLGVSLAVESCRTPEIAPVETGRRSGQRWEAGHIITLIAGWLLMCSLARAVVGTSHAWQDRSRLQADVAKIAKTLRVAARVEGYPDNEVIVYVYADPALVFYLKSNGLPLVSPIQSPEGAIQPHPRPTFLAVRRYRECDTDSQSLDRLIEDDKLAEHSSITTRVSHLHVFDQVRFEADFGEMRPEVFFNPYIGLHRVKN